MQILQQENAQMKTANFAITSQWNWYARLFLDGNNDGLVWFDHLQCVSKGIDLTGNDHN